MIKPERLAEHRESNIGGMREAGDQQDGDLRISLRHPFRQRDAIHRARHADIRQHQVETAAALQNIHRLAGVRCGDDRATHGFERPGDHAAQPDVVLDQQHCETLEFQRGARLIGCHHAQDFSGKDMAPCFYTNRPSPAR